MKYSMSEFDCFFISYDEPQKEEFWAHLQNIAPWAQRIDGVRGFDSAHKRAAELSQTERFITVDGDTLTSPEFFELEIDIPEKFKDCVLSWNSHNAINGLCYGNGGLKCWTRDFVLGMRTHEAASTGAETVDFCWDARYLQLNNSYSTTCPNASPFQAWRAGFREGVKMTLDRGIRVCAGQLTQAVHARNLRRLLVWTSVGADVENGLWAVYGARCGVAAANIESTFDLAQISDYEWFKNYFYTEIAPQFSGDGSQRCRRTGQLWEPALVHAASSALIEPVARQTGLLMVDLGAEQSAWFKRAAESVEQRRDPLACETAAP